MPRSTIAYDSASGTLAEEMKVVVEDGALVRMDKQLAVSCSCGENLGVLRLDHDVAEATFAHAERLVCLDGGARSWLASAVNEVAADHRLDCLDVAGTPWIEIDFPEDLERARRVVHPAICAMCSGDPALAA
jgi:choline kinase